MQCGVQISVLSVTLRNLQQRMLELLIIEDTSGSDTVKQRMIPGGSNDERLTDVGTTSFVPTSVTLSSLLPPMV